MKPGRKFEIIIYPNNTSCVSGRFSGATATAVLLREMGIPFEREHDSTYNTPVARVIAFGRTSEPFRVIAARAGATRKLRGIM